MQKTNGRQSPPTFAPPVRLTKSESHVSMEHPMGVLEYIDLASNLFVVGVFVLVVVILPAATALKWVVGRLKRNRA